MQPDKARARGAARLCFMACALLVGITNASDTEKPLQLVLYTPLNIDGNSTTASTTLRLHNPNSTQLRYILSIRNAIAKNTNKGADWVVSFFGADNKPAGPVLEGSLAANASLSVRVDLSHVVEAGETTAELSNNNVKIADLTLLKEQGLPFKVFLEGNPAEKPEIEFVSGSPLSLRWRNDDAMHYPVSWQFYLKGKSVRGTATIGPNGSSEFTLTPNEGWFSLYQSFFKNETVDGTVTVGYQPQGSLGAYPSKTIPIKARLSAYDPAAREVVTIFVILFFLALGGLASTYVNVDLVNRIKAISIKKRLGQLSRVIGEIGPQLNSQLRVSLWLERGRIEATLPNRILFTPETAAAIAQSDADTEALKVRVDWASQISDASVRLTHTRDEGSLAASLADQVFRDLTTAQDLLRKSVLSPGELQKVQSLVGGATNTLDSKGKPDDDLEKVIAARLQDLKTRFTTSFLASGTCAAIKTKVPIPFGLIDASGPVIVSQEERDANTRKLAVIADLVQMQSTAQEVLECLGRQDFASVIEAEFLLRELRDGVSLNDLRAAITANPPEMYFIVDRDLVRVNTPIMMKLMFNNHLYNRAAARWHIECTWNFDHNNLTEKGWEIHHYFPTSKNYVVKVTFKDINQVVILPAVSIEQKIIVSEQKIEGRNYRWVAVQKWAVGFFVAIISLFAGAKDKILLFDTAGAIFAVFLLGFGIDTVKNLLVSK